MEGIEPASNPHPSLSQQCKEKRDAAVMAFHAEGKSDNAIAKLCGMNHVTVGNIIKEHVVKNGDSPNLTTPEVTPHVIPMANTQARPDHLRLVVNLEDSANLPPPQRPSQPHRTLFPDLSMKRGL